MMHSGIPSNPSAAWSQTLAPVVIKPTADRPSIDPSKPELICEAKVLHLANGEHFSGAERVQSHLGRCLPEFGVTADFALVKPGKFADMLDEKAPAWGAGYRTPMSHRIDIRPAWDVRHLVRENGYHLLHAHTPRTAMIASLASRLTGTPWVYHVHSPAARDSNRSVSNHVNAIIERYSLRNARHLITVSESLRLDYIRCGVPEERVSVVHNGVPAIRPPRKATPKVGAEWTIGMIALQRPRKGLEVALRALARLTPKYPIKLRVIGPFETPGYQAEINRMIDRLDLWQSIERVGFTDDVPGELSRLDAMVLPSLFGEGLPMVVLEAMAAAVPVIATRVEGTPEAITDGAEGLLAEPGDDKSLAGKIQELITGTHDWNVMSEAAFNRHAKDFSDMAMARNTACVYRRLLFDSKPF